MIEWACRVEVLAPKPGNVNAYGRGHGMEVEDFLHSAQAIAPVLSIPGKGVGERILAAVIATKTVVKTNTNLGIILLFSPLARATLEAEKPATLRQALTTVLARLDIDDARLAYQGIRLAQPGGMGHSPAHDIAEEPQVTLLEAMQWAAEWDNIARQYHSGFGDIFELGIPSLLEGFAKWENIEWATTLAYLTFLATLPDSLVRRKYGATVAAQVAQKASQIQKQLIIQGPGFQMETKLRAWDQALKRDLINPGTSADLTAATLLVGALCQTSELKFLEA
ncbi:triphosphoribosyl-dephospho-CoA synthase [Nitrosococcus wardiae]|uniref:Triphosphoribosyl-dephospho-CoA synthase n=1 Tax=Nitrosococcus wardiae TaxID=1814290 RepID=A0A4P7C5X5_9GAMM|nr:triphosphoribosyl-dephospho-CoA synthase [Nitrosococcus wardiae]